MINKSHFILYVKNQEISTEFYSNFLDLSPTLNVPGMTEFSLSENTVLGLMPEKGIENLLNKKVSVVTNTNKSIKAEIYLVVNSIDQYVERAKKYSIKILSEAENRDWGDRAAYFLDPDQHVIAIAEKISR